MIWLAAPGSQLIHGSWLRECTAVGHLYWRIFIIALLASIYPWGSSRMEKEDQMLRSKFGKEWDTWSKAVPYWLIPGVY